MAYNQIRYNLSAFNIDAGGARYLSVSGAEKVTSAIGTNLQAVISAIGNERVSVELAGAKGKFLTATGTETIAELIVEGMTSIILFPVGEENVTGTVEQSVIVCPKIQAAETVNGNLTLEKAVYLYTNYAEEVSGESISAVNVYPEVDGYEIVTESASLIAIDTVACYIGNSTSTFTLKPGEVLIVDASTYNVLLNSKNAIYTQSGEWIDELTPETTNISVTASSGARYLSATIMYLEKFL